MNRQKENFVDTRELVENSSNLAAILEEQGIRIDENAADSLLRYYEMIVEKNKVMNLTRITEFEDAVRKHFADSLSLISAAPEAAAISKEAVSVIDVGTGAGFPGVPLKLAFPNVKLTLLDSLNKRITFLNEVVDKLQLDNVTTLHARAEEGGRNPKLRDKFDFAVSRAVANLSALTEYTLPYVKVGGLFISYKSGDIEEELKSSERAIKLLGGKLETVRTFQLADSDISRSFVIIRKEKPTPKAYPRKPGTAKRYPL